MTFKSQKATGRYGQKRAVVATLQFSGLFIFWVILSGRFQVKYITFGVIAAGLVTLLTNELFYSLFYREGSEQIKVRLFLRQICRFLAYLPWLFYKIIRANIQVAYLVLHPRMPIEPAFLLFRSQMRLQLAQVILGNSITLTPGTVTASLEDGTYIIHTLVPSSAGDILEANLQNKIAAIFSEKKEQPPTALWAYSLKETGH